ncbi:MAG: hypothetical protein KatS3mg102_0759 [Planctomycetota bacterium]|nr:MAG: hypothetical protein KatS3mg102_0759 [Planctomycetota bacterium]
MAELPSLPPLTELAAAVRERLAEVSRRLTRNAEAAPAALGAEELGRVLREVLERVLARAREELGRLRERCEELEGAAAQLRAERERAEAARAELAAALEQERSARAELAEAHEQQSRARAQECAAREEVEQLLREASRALEEADAEREQLAERLEAECRRAEEQQAEHQRRLAASEAELEAVRRERARALARAETAERDLEEVRARLADALVEIERLRKELSIGRTIELDGFGPEGEPCLLAGAGERGQGAPPAAHDAADDTVDLPACDLPGALDEEDGAPPSELPIPPGLRAPDPAAEPQPAELGPGSGTPASAAGPQPAAVQDGGRAGRLEPGATGAAPQAAGGHATDVEHEPAPARATAPVDDTVRLPAPLAALAAGAHRHDPQAAAARDGTDGGRQAEAPKGMLLALARLAQAPVSASAAEPAGPGAERPEFEDEPLAAMGEFREARPYPPPSREQAPLPTVEVLFGRPPGPHRPGTAVGAAPGAGTRRRQARSGNGDAAAAGAPARSAASFGFGAALCTPSTWRRADAAPAPTGGGVGAALGTC